MTGCTRGEANNSEGTNNYSRQKKLKIENSLAYDLKPAWGIFPGSHIARSTIAVICGM